MSTYILKQNVMRRWILWHPDGKRAWSGRRWVPCSPGGLPYEIQVCNFDTEEDARTYAESFDLPAENARDEWSP